MHGGRRLGTSQDVFGVVGCHVPAAEAEAEGAEEAPRRLARARAAALRPLEAAAAAAGEVVLLLQQLRRSDEWP